MRLVGVALASMLLALAIPAEAQEVVPVLTTAQWTEEGVSLEWTYDGTADGWIVTRLNEDGSQSVMSLTDDVRAFMDTTAGNAHIYTVAPVNDGATGTPSQPMGTSGYPYCWPNVQLRPLGVSWPWYCYIP